MQSGPQRFSRIVGALEDLAAQESTALAARDFAAALAVQERAAPLVEFLAANATGHAGDSVLRARISAIQARRSWSAGLLASEIERVRAELQQTGVAQRRVAKIAPVYGRSAVPHSQLSAVG